MTERETLKGKKRGSDTLIDMEKVYRQLDGGRTVQSVADEWGVSRSTLYRRHLEYQKSIAILKNNREDLNREFAKGLPPIPEEMLEV